MFSYTFNGKNKKIKPKPWVWVRLSQNTHKPFFLTPKPYTATPLSVSLSCAAMATALMDEQTTKKVIRQVDYGFSLYVLILFYRFDYGMN